MTIVLKLLYQEVASTMSACPNKVYIRDELDIEPDIKYILHVYAVWSYTLVNHQLRCFNMFACFVTELDSRCSKY